MARSKLARNCTYGSARNPAKQIIMKGIYRHKKGNIYRVLFEAKHSETLEDLVIYQDVNDESKIWARPKSMFLDKGRFTKIDDNTK